MRNKPILKFKPELRFHMEMFRDQQLIALKSNERNEDDLVTALGADFRLCYSRLYSRRRLRKMWKQFVRV